MFAPDVDDYHVDFSGVEKAEHKALLMAMVIFIDFRYFNNNSNDGETRQKAQDMLRESLMGSSS